MMSGEPLAHRRAPKLPEAMPPGGGGASGDFSVLRKAEPFRSSWRQSRIDIELAPLRLAPLSEITQVLSVHHLERL